MPRICLEGKKSCSLMVKLFSKKLQRGYISLSQSTKLDLSRANNDHDAVKKGHFAVFAAGGGEPKRFIIELEFLSNPCFLRLLELAEEEYGFQQEGALAVPCRPEVLEQLLQSKSRKRGSSNRKLATKVLNIIDGY